MYIYYIHFSLSIPLNPTKLTDQKERYDTHYMNRLDARVGRARFAAESGRSALFEYHMPLISNSIEELADVAKKI